VMLANPRNRLERRQNDAAVCELEFRGGGGGKVVWEVLHRSFIGSRVLVSPKPPSEAYPQGNQRSFQ
jgi:hypothetical protein